MSFLKKIIFFVAIFSLFAVPSAFAKRSLYYDPDTRSVYFGSKRTSRYNGYERKHGFYTPSYLSEKDKRSYRKHVRHSMERDKLSKKEQRKIKRSLKKQKREDRKYRKRMRKSHNYRKHSKHSRKKESTRLRRASKRSRDHRSSFQSPQEEANTLVRQICVAKKNKTLERDLERLRNLKAQHPEVRVPPVTIHSRTKKKRTGHRTKKSDRVYIYNPQTNQVVKV